MALPFAGRALELDRARRLLESAASGKGGVLLVSGEAGIGKTRFLQEVALRGAPRWRALWGHAAKHEASEAYAPFAQMLDDYVEIAEQTAVRSDLELSGCAVATISRRLAAVAFEDERTQLTASNERLRLFDGATQFLLAASRRRPLLLILEDLHWADADTLDLLGHFAQFIGQERVMVAVSYRRAESDHAVTRINELQRLRAIEHIELEGLRQPELQQILTEIDERAAPELLARIARETGGNPLFAREVLQELVDTGRFELDRQGEEPLAIPASVSAAVRERFARLSENARGLLTAASATADAFTLEVASAAAGISEEAALDALDDALAAQLIRVRGGATYEFQHSLFAQAIYSQLNPSRQERLHRRIAEAIVQTRGRRASEHAGAIAEHFSSSKNLSGADNGVPYALAAASDAARAAAFDARVRFLQIALDLTARDDPSYPRTLGLLATAFAATGGFNETVERAQQASRMIAEKEGGEAAAAFIEDLMSRLAERFPMSHAWTIAQEGLRYASAQRSERWCRLRMYALVAEEHERPDFTGMLTCRDPQWDELFELCRQNGWEPVFRPVAPSSRKEILAEHTNNRVLMLLFAGELTKARLMYRVDERHEGPLAAAIGSARVALCNANLGDLPAAASDLQRAIALSARVGVPHAGAAAAIGDAAFAVTLVRNHGWERLARQTDAIVDDSGMAFGMDGANAVITGAVAHAYAGDEARALEGLQRVIPAVEIGHGRVYGFTRLVCLAVEVNWALHRSDHLPLLEGKLRHEIIAPDFRAPSVDARRSLGLLHALRGDKAEAARWFEKSRDVLEEQGARALRAIVDFDEASCLMLSRDATHVGRAEELTVAALGRFHELDMRGWVHHAEALLSETRLNAGPRRDLPDRLTAREAQVLGLIAAGRTNREISDDLTLSVRTVARHITNIYAKIGARGKADATAYAIKHRLQ